MPYVHTVRCPNVHRFVEVCTPDEDGDEMGTRFEFHCPLRDEDHRFGSMAVEILDEDEECPPDAVKGRAFVAL